MAGVRVSRSATARVVVAAVMTLGLLAGCSPEETSGRRTPPPTSGSAPTTSTPPATTAVAAPWPEPSTAAFPTAVAARLQQVLADALDGGGLTGLSASVVSTEGTWIGAVGRSGAGQPLTTASVLPLLSVTKMITAAEALTLAQRGELDLDRPVSSYVRLPFRDNGATVRQALQMRTGFPEYVDDGVIALVSRTPDRAVDPLAQMARSGDAQPGPPDGAFDYCNTNYGLVGEVVEKVTGLPFGVAVRRDLLGPARLAGLVVQPGERPRGPLAQPVKATRGRQPYLPNLAVASVAGGAGSAAGDAASTARFVYDLVGGRLLPPDVVATMLPEQGLPYGVGTMPLTVAFSSETPGVGHTGGVVGNTAAAGAQPDRRLAIAVLVAGDGGPQGVLASLGSAVLAPR